MEIPKLREESEDIIHKKIVTDKRALFLY